MTKAHMTIPPFLKPGSTIGITCPSGYVSEDRVQHARKVLSDWGFQTVTGETVGNEYHYFSGDDTTRARDLQKMLDDPAIDAILMGRGGYGLSRIIDTLDFTHFSRHPKWICGFSDITVLHSHIQSLLGIPTLHSVMCGAFRPDTEQNDYILSLRDALTGKALQYTFPAVAANRAGTAEGILVGGNLAMLAHLTGSDSQINTEDRILFIEDIGEHYYQVDRMLLNLKRSGQLSRLRGLLVGSFTDMQDTERPFGQSIEEIVMDKVIAYNYPVAFGFPCGHQEENVTLMLGTHHRLEAGGGHSLLQQLPIQTI